MSYPIRQLLILSLSIGLLVFPQYLEAKTLIKAVLGTDKTHLFLEFDDNSVEIVCLPPTTKTISSFSLSADLKTVNLTYSDNSTNLLCLPEFPGSNLPPEFFEEIGGKISIPATGYFENIPASGSQWTVIGNAVKSLHSDPTVRFNGSEGAHLTYKIKVNSSADYYIWIKGVGVDGNSDSVHYGIDNTLTDTMDFSGVTAMRFVNKTRNDQVAKINVAQAGVHTLDIWTRENGFIFEAIEISKDPNYKP